MGWEPGGELDRNNKQISEINKTNNEREKSMIDNLEKDITTVDILEGYRDKALKITFWNKK